MGRSPSSEDLARYLEEKGTITKPWHLLQLRLSKLKEQKDALGPDEYMARIQDAHADLMRMGEFWRGRELETFGTTP